jgi:hypothetical protein
VWFKITLAFKRLTVCLCAPVVYYNRTPWVLSLLMILRPEGIILGIDLPAWVKSGLFKSTLFQVFEFYILYFAPVPHSLIHPITFLPSGICFHPASVFKKKSGQPCSYPDNLMYWS